METAINWVNSVSFLKISPQSLVLPIWVIFGRPNRLISKDCRHPIWQIYLKNTYVSWFEESSFCLDYGFFFLVLSRDFYFLRGFWMKKRILELNRILRFVLVEMNSFQCFFKEKDPHDIDSEKEGKNGLASYQVCLCLLIVLLFTRGYHSVLLLCKFPFLLCNRFYFVSGSVQLCKCECSCNNCSIANVPNHRVHQLQWYGASHNIEPFSTKYLGDTLLRWVVC